eukprot:g5209.t1
MQKRKDAEGTKKIWTACALFISTVQCKQVTIRGETAREGNCLRLTQLLKETGVRFSEFLEHIPFFFNKLKLGQAAEDNLKILKEKFKVATYIFKKFKQLWDETRARREEKKTATEDDERGNERSLMRFAWIFFLLAKYRITGGGAADTDLAKSYHVLVSSLFWVLLRSSRNKLDEKVLLGDLCTLANVEISDMRHTEQQLAAFVTSVSINSSSTTANVGSRTTGSLLRGKVDVPMTNGGVLSVYYLDKNVSSLSRAYESLKLVSVWEINELFFLNSVVSDQICTPAKTRPALTPAGGFHDSDAEGAGGGEGGGDDHHLASSHTPKKRLQLSQNQRPSKRSRRSSEDRRRQRALLQTPVSAAVKARTWFARTMSDLPERPSSVLERFFAVCSINPSERIATLVDLLPRRHISAKSSGGVEDENKSSTFVLAGAASSSAAPRKSIMFSPMLAPRKGSTGSDHRLERCRSCCVRLYYQTLESLLVSEQERLETMNHESLLKNESFHRALLSCCMEISLKSCNYVTLAFPSTLKTFEVSPVDLCKMLESFAKHQSDLPVMLRRHLSSVEEQIIESMAWHDPRIQDQADASQNNIDGLPSKSVAHLVRKTKLLAMGRTVKLARMLGLSRVAVAKMRETIGWAIEHVRSLLYGRHLDNTVLCVVYGVAKVMRLKPDVSFKQIIKTHARWKGAKLEVIRHIVLNSADERGDVIQFYNKVFIPAMKSYLLSLQASLANSSKANRVGRSSGGGEPRRQRGSGENDEVNGHRDDEADGEDGEGASNGHSPRRVPNTNVYMVQRRPFMTPRTRALYAFGESPRRDLDRINFAVNHDMVMPPISEVLSSPGTEAAANRGSIEEFLRQRHGEKLRK